MGEDQNEVYRKLSSLSMLVTGGLIFILVFTISMTSLMVWQAYRSGSQAVQIETVAKETHAALCTFKADLKRRYESGLEYYAKHPSGAPSIGVTAADLERSLNAQKATLDSLAILDCS